MAEFIGVDSFNVKNREIDYSSEAKSPLLAKLENQKQPANVKEAALNIESNLKNSFKGEHAAIRVNPAYDPSSGTNHSVLYVSAWKNGKSLLATDQDKILKQVQGSFKKGEASVKVEHDAVVVTFDR